MLSIIGSILLLVGGVFGLVLLIHAFKESIGQGLLSLFVPFYIFYYGFAKYQSPKKGLVLGGWLGSIAVGMGLFVVGAMQFASTTAQAIEAETGKWEAAAAQGRAAQDQASANEGGPVELAKLGLKGDAPSGSSVGDAIVGKGTMIQGPGFAVTVEEAGDERPKTLKEAKSEAEMYSPKSTKEHELDDGWALTFQNEGSAGTNYFLRVRRSIGGTDYYCDTMSAHEDGRDRALEFCKSLRK